MYFDQKAFAFFDGVLFSSLVVWLFTTHQKKGLCYYTIQQHTRPGDHGEISISNCKAIINF